MTTQEAIETYRGYFEDQLKKIFLIEDRLHKKLLLVAVLETLARARNPQEQSTKQRFLKLISDCSGWHDRARVGLIQLSLLLPPDRTTKLQAKVLALLSTWQYGRIYGLEVDPLITELEPLASENEIPLVKKCLHANLLYVYRNHLVHEFREPGHGHEMKQDEKPYYHGLTNLNFVTKTKHETWELVYPVGFFHALAIASLKNLSEHLLKNELDPYSCYRFGTQWSHQ